MILIDIRLKIKNIYSILKELNFEFKDKIGLTKGESILIYQKK